MIPRATYRLQFNKTFRFEHATALADYFAALGVSHIYASPIMKARAGSAHGYDVVDFGEINPELGGEADFRLMAGELRKRGVGIIVDIVPNHMAVGQNDNPWWLDVLRNGKASVFAGYFDIDWEAPGLEGRILAPLIDGPPERALARGDLKLVREGGATSFAYFGHRFPLRPEDEATLVGTDIERLSDGELLSILNHQHYVLSDWRDADARINWRRFFDISELAALRMENDAAFEAVHAKMFSLYEEGLIDGMRVDHVDGFADPRAYCQKLRARLDALDEKRTRRAGRAYLIVEKILARDEMIPDDWQVDGTTGYDFMEDVSALLHAESDVGRLRAFWSATSGRPDNFEPEELLARSEILSSSFVAQRDGAVRAMAVSGLPSVQAKEALTDVLVHLRAYRTYATGRTDSPEPGFFFSEASSRAKIASPSDAPSIDAIDRRMRAKSGEPSQTLGIRRFNQLAAPLAAKSVEDTAFYRYGALLSRNEVGSDPKIAGIEIGEFHRRMIRRAGTFPNTMNTTATHDHKRGEDARARLAVLSEMPQLWCEQAGHWLASVPAGVDRGDAYQLLQTLIGAWPLGSLDEHAVSQFSGRIALWCRKFLREGKLRSSWRAPDAVYEERFISLAKDLIGSARWREEIERFIANISPVAIANTLAQVVLRMTCPGVPDLYQGRERWDFSLVDPDNRTPVDFAVLRRGGDHQLVSNAAAWSGGSMKQALVSKLLQVRRCHAELLAAGSYEAIAVDGPRADHVLAFERRFGNQFLLTAVSLKCASALCGRREIAPQSDWWGNTALTANFDFPLRDLLSDTTISDYPIMVADLFEVLPVAVLVPPQDTT